MASAFYESNLRQQRDCLIKETYKNKPFFYQLSFRSNTIWIKCCFGQMSFRSSVVWSNVVRSTVIQSTVVAWGLQTINPISIKVEIMWKPFFFYTFLLLYCLFIGLPSFIFERGEVTFKLLPPMHMIMNKILFFLLEKVLDRVEFSDGIQGVWTGLREHVFINAITFSRRVLN